MSAIHLGRHEGPSPRTYRDLLTMGRDSQGGTCCSCHRWSGEMPEKKRKLFSLAARSNICVECCERKGDEVLGPIKRAEASAHHYARQLIKNNDDIDRAAGFYARLSQVTEEFFRKAYALEQAKHVSSLAKA